MGYLPQLQHNLLVYGTGRFEHSERDRALTLCEGALLQSFPADYQFVPLNESIQIKKIALHIGNAVSPRLGEIIGQSIVCKFQKRK